MSGEPFDIDHLGERVARDASTAVRDQVNPVEAILREDPAEVYAAMDCETRDRYRRAVEDLAQGSGLSDIEVARLAIGLANLADRESNYQDDFRRRHVGYYLIDRGRDVLEVEIGYQPTLREHVSHAILRHPTLAYLGSIGLLTVVGAFCAVLLAVVCGGSWFVCWAAGLLALLPASELAVGLVNYAVTTGTRASHLAQP